LSALAVLHGSARPGRTIDCVRRPRPPDTSVGAPSALV
jgi:hypothetical protein